MNKNEIKKALYKENPEASLAYVVGGVAWYGTTVNGETIAFAVPGEDMGTTRFYPKMEAKHLIRWIV